jgi:hypothetical protein
MQPLNFKLICALIIHRIPDILSKVIATKLAIRLIIEQNYRF